jgi:6-phosphogluconate dehydrogenase
VDQRNGAALRHPGADHARRRRSALPVGAQGRTGGREQGVARPQGLGGERRGPHRCRSRRALLQQDLLVRAGLDLLAAADADKKWGLDLGEIARIWKGGCIIRARFLRSIQTAYKAQKQLPNLLLDPELGGFLQQHQTAWRKVVALAAEHGVPTLAMGGSLSYFDSFRRARLPQNLTQAQRDLFGAHTFERTDRPAGEAFHHEWP